VWKLFEPVEKSGSLPKSHNRRSPDGAESNKRRILGLMDGNRNLADHINLGTASIWYSRCRCWRQTPNFSRHEHMPLEAKLDEFGARLNPLLFHHPVFVKSDGPRRYAEDGGCLFHRFPFSQKL
jgi:hypothetical protein